MSIVKVDCVENRDLCMKNKVQAFPMLRLFKDGEIQPPDYRSDRTVDAFVAFIKTKITTDDHVARLDPVQQEAHKKSEELRRDDHPGCMMSGFLLVNRLVFSTLLSGCDLSYFVVEQGARQLPHRGSLFPAQPQPSYVQHVACREPLVIWTCVAQKC